MNPFIKWFWFTLYNIKLLFVRFVIKAVLRKHRFLGNIVLEGLIYMYSQSWEKNQNGPIPVWPVTHLVNVRAQTFPVILLYIVCIRSSDTLSSVFFRSVWQQLWYMAFRYVAWKILFPLEIWGRWGPVFLGSWSV